MSAALIHQNRWKTLRVLALSLVIIGLDNTILNVALPSLQEHFDASDPQAYFGTAMETKLTALEPPP